MSVFSFSCTALLDFGKILDNEKSEDDGRLHSEDRHGDVDEVSEGDDFSDDYQ